MGKPEFYERLRVFALRKELLCFANGGKLESPIKLGIAAMFYRNKTFKTYSVRDFEKKEPKVKQSACGRAVREFCKNTTLHGFKYLASKTYYDRVGWLVCCGASACCAGALCSVLWARFVQVPALLTLRERAPPAARLPLLAVCPSAHAVAYYFLKHLSIPEDVRSRLPVILSHVLRREKTPNEQLEVLEDLLVKNNLSLPEALMRLTPPCRSIVLNCRWQSQMMPCDALFEKELTDWGACCVTRPYTFSVDEIKTSRLEVTRKLGIAVQCSDQSTFNGCEFFTRYEGEERAQPQPLAPAHQHLAHVTFTSVADSDADKLTPGTCVAAPEYTTGTCLLECKERRCGCAEPLRRRSARGALRPCRVTQLACLRTSHFEKNASCNCLPGCKRVFTYMALESSPMNAFQYTLDELYAGLNASTSSVLRIAVRMSESRLFVVNSTETWITLLSSLGGVFNMFLGVGLFSALEVLFLIFVRLPIAIRRSSHMGDG